MSPIIFWGVYFILNNLFKKWKPKAKKWKCYIVHAYFKALEQSILQRVDHQLEAPGKTLCRMCACSPQLSAAHWKWMFGYLGRIRSLNHSSTVTKFDTRVVASFWLFVFFLFHLSFSRSTSTRLSFTPFTNKLTGSPLIRIWLQCA